MCVISNQPSYQVSHHPPACAQHVEHKDWTFWQDFTMGSKFRGKYLQIIPYGEVCINQRCVVVMVTLYRYSSPGISQYWRSLHMV